MQFDDYVNVILFILFTIIAIRYVVDKTKKRIKSLEAIPGLKKTHPKFGNLLELTACGSLHQFLEKLHETHGDIATFFWEDTIIVSICNHESFKCIQKLFDRPPLVFGGLRKFLGENSIQFCNGSEGLNKRKQYDKAFQHQAIIRYITDIEQVGNNNLDDIKRQGSPIKSINQMCSLMALKSILKTCLLPINKDKEFYENILRLYKSVFTGIENHFVKLNINPNSDDEEIQFRKDKSEIYEIIRKMISERMAVLENSDHDNEELLLIDQIILYNRDINKELIENEAMDFMIGGFHTSGNALAWCIYYLSENRECQEKPYEEISLKPFRLTNTIECYKEILDMKYLRACIDETLRLSQLAPYAARVSHEDLLLKPYRIPANTPIILALGVSFKDPAIFKNNDQFNPERFIHNDFPSFSFTPFGFAGKRKCPGERFSYLELSIWLIQLVGKYSFSLTNLNQKVNKRYGLVTSMVEDVSINFHER